MNNSDTMRKKTTIPLPVLIGETRLLYQWCQSDKAVLLSLGLDWEIVEELPVLCSNSEELYTQCQVEKIVLSKRRKNLESKFKDASRLRTEISDKIRYLFAATNDIRSFTGYSTRRTYSEIIGDLHNLAGLCKKFEENLATIGFDKRQTDVLSLLAEQLRNEQLQIYENDLAYNDLRKSYLLSYHKLYESVQYVRRCAFEVFPPDSFRRKGYYSHYRESHRK